MKNIFLTLSILVSACASAQVAIGKASLTKLADNITPNPSISLEFGNENRGIVLPWVNGTNNTTPFISGSPTTEIVANGTIVFSTNDAKIKVKYASGWKDLTVKNNTDIIPGITNQTVNTSLQDSLSDLETAKVLIGGNPDTDTTPGILVLADTDKAMVLPKVASPHLNIVNPAAGMMVYNINQDCLQINIDGTATGWKCFNTQTCPDL